MTQKPIPRSISRLLKHPWPADDCGCQPGQSRLFYRPDLTAGRTCGGLKFSQVRDLVNDGVLTNDWRGQG